MPSQLHQSLPLTKDNLYQLIAMNPAPIGRSAIINVFGHDSGETLDVYLGELMADHLIIPDKGKGFHAAKPWADIGYAEVGPISHDRATPISLKLLNMPHDVTVTMSRHEAHRAQINTGDRIVVGLIRHTHGTLRAQFISPIGPDQVFHLVGIFNHHAHNFTPLDRSIKTSFTLAQEPVAREVPRQFLVEMRPDFDIRHPVIHVADDQRRNVESGTAVGWILLDKYGLAQPHPDNVIQNATRIHRSKLDLKGRDDLRHLHFVTVDPAGAQDLDDAFVALKTDDGYDVYTAIADVAAHVLYKSAVDVEAYRRGTTVYLEKYTAHMLPPLLSTNKCSLIPHHDRLAIVLKQSFGHDGNRKSFSIHPAVINSREQLSYGQFYDLLDQGDERFKAIATLHETRRRKNLDAGLSAFFRDADQYVSKSIVETLMVQMNSLIAQTLDRSNVPFLSRNFVQHTDSDIIVPGLIPRAYYSSRAMGHAHLGQHYAHATSPIRRYADLIVLRALHKIFGFHKTALHDEEIKNLEQISQHLNQCRQREGDIAHDEQKYHALRDLKRFGSATIRINIYELGPDYVEVVLMQTGLRKRIPVSALPPDKWRIDAQRHQLVLLDGHGQELHRYNRNEGIHGRIFNVDHARAHWNIELIPPEQIMRRATLPTAIPA